MKLTFVARLQFSAFVVSVYLLWLETLKASSRCSSVMEGCNFFCLLFVCMALKNNTEWGFLFTLMASFISFMLNFFLLFSFIFLF